MAAVKIVSEAWKERAVVLVPGEKRICCGSRAFPEDVTEFVTGSDSLKISALGFPRLRLRAPREKGVVPRPRSKNLQRRS